MLKLNKAGIYLQSLLEMGNGTIPGTSYFDYKKETTVFITSAGSFLKMFSLSLLWDEASHTACLRLFHLFFGPCFTTRDKEVAQRKTRVADSPQLLIFSLIRELPQYLSARGNYDKIVCKGRLQLLIERCRNPCDPSARHHAAACGRPVTASYNSRHDPVACALFLQSRYMLSSATPFSPAWLACPPLHHISTARRSSLYCPRKRQHARHSCPHRALSRLQLPVRMSYSKCGSGAP